MDQHFVSARLDERVQDVLHKTMERWVDDIPVLNENNRLAGIIRLVDLVRAAIEPPRRAKGMSQIPFEDYQRRFDYQERVEMKIQLPELFELYAQGSAQIVDIRFHEEDAA